MPSLEEPSKPRKIEEPSKPKKGRDLKPGHVLENRYEILEKLGSSGASDTEYALGSGASATVYAVQDLVKGRKVALKHFESYKGASRQCAAEGDNMKRLNSVETAQAFVPDVYDTFISEGRHCLTMEFYDCKTLKDELKEANRKGLPVKDIRYNLLNPQLFS
ncbi:hypothetical protein T484DRAFT_1811304 [Baffinella frigidus]|nr:hypothetical protein T484DRAFT_1811304 [Cryptophyta sp. CCMP2293]